MQKNVYLLLSGLCFIACNKSNSPGNNNKLVLTRYVKIENQDSVAYDFTYDANKKVIGMTFSGTGFGPTLDVSQTLLIRNSSGRIAQLVNTYPGQPVQFYANDTTQVFYDNANARYSLLLTRERVDANGQAADSRDSTILVYDNGNRIVELKSYLFSSSSGSSYALNAAHFFQYDNQANLVSDSDVAYSIGGSQPEWTIKYTLDDKPNPLPLGNEALLLPDRDWIGLPRISGWYSAHNALTGYYTFIQGAISNFSVQRTFQYNSLGSPLGSSDQWWTPSVGTSPGSTRYYYQ